MPELNFCARKDPNPSVHMGSGELPAERPVDTPLRATYVCCRPTVPNANEARPAVWVGSWRGERARIQQ